MLDMHMRKLYPVMNNTKWEELRLAMYSLGDLHPKWRTKDVETGFIPEWDGEWFYHFRNGAYESIEWVEIQVTSAMQDAAILQILRSIHVPGERTEHGYRVFGYAEPGKAVDYIE
jgi:hypothetical protein